VHGDTSLALTSYLPTLTPQSLSTQSSHTPSAASTRSRSECHTDTRRRACIHDPSSTVPDPQRYVPPPAHHHATTSRQSLVLNGCASASVSPTRSIRFCMASIVPSTVSFPLPFQHPVHPHYLFQPSQDSSPLTRQDQATLVRPSWDQGVPVG
jgi:hypothetical protein